MALTSADYSCVFANVVVFCVFQCAFFYFIASRQYDTLLKHKMRIIEPFLEHDRPGKQVACAKLLGIMATAERRMSKTARMNALLDAGNRRTVYMFAGPYIGVAALLALFFMVRAKRQKVWRGEHNLAYALLVFCFSTEIFYYLGVVKTYRVIGDWELIDRVFEAVVEGTSPDPLRGFRP